MRTLGLFLRDLQKKNKSNNYLRNAIGHFVIAPWCTNSSTFPGYTCLSTRWAPVEVLELLTVCPDIICLQTSNQGQLRQGLGKDAL